MVISAGDLAPGDAKAATLDLRGFAIERIESGLDPLFALAYGVLAKEFGAKGELEPAAMLRERFEKRPSIFYEVVFIRHEARWAAVRDHSAVAIGGEVVVHLSHCVVAPEFRRTGLAGWVRALPLATARACAAAHGLPAQVPVTLVAEMEYVEDPSSPMPALGQSAHSRWIRLLAYERAGFLKVDPAQVAYYQPDFSAQEQMEANGGPVPLPFQLVVRQVGLESQGWIGAQRLRKIVEALYTVYEPQIRAQRHPLLDLARYEWAQTQIPLRRPSE